MLSLSQCRNFPSFKLSTCPAPCVQGYFWACIISRDPSGVSKANRSHVVIFQFSFINLRYIPWSPLKRFVIFLKILNFKRLFLKLNHFICNDKSIHPIHCPHVWERWDFFLNQNCLLVANKKHHPSMYNRL